MGGASTRHADGRGCRQPCGLTSSLNHFSDRVLIVPSIRAASIAVSNSAFRAASSLQADADHAEHLAGEQRAGKLRACHVFLFHRHQPEPLHWRQPHRDDR